MSIKHLYPTSTPALNLNFKSSRVADPRITTTRASTATYVDPLTGLIKTAAANVARVEKDGLLVEEERTNLTLNSEDFTAAYWTKSNTTVTANQDVAPDGTTTADLIYPSSTGTSRSVYRTIGSNSGTFTVSFFVKAAGINWVYIYNAQGNSKAWFNLSTGTKGSADTPFITDYNINSYGNGWYRCYVRTDSTTFQSHAIGLSDADNSNTVTASGTNGVYLWGAQFEEGYFPTSYIPTSGSTVTRNADVASMTDMSFINPNEATHWVTCKYKYMGIWNGLGWATSTNNNNQAYDVYFGPSTSFNGGYVATKIGQLSSSIYGVSAPSDIFNTAHAGGTGINRVRVNGSTPSTWGSQTFPMTAPTHLYFGSFRGLYYWFNGHINRVCFYSSALPENQLEIITT